VLCHLQAGTRDDERGGRRDVERARPIAAGAAGVHDTGVLVLHGHGTRPHRGRTARDLIDRLAARAQRQQERTDLRGRRRAIHDHAHRPRGRGAVQRSARGQPREHLLELQVAAHEV
jgi:hypothetical protein